MYETLKKKQDLKSSAVNQDLESSAVNQDLRSSAVNQAHTECL